MRATLRRKIFNDLFAKVENNSFLTDYLANADFDTRFRRFLGVETEIELLDRINSDFYYLKSRDLSQNEGYEDIYKHNRRLYKDSHVRQCPLGITFKRGAYKNKFMVDEAIDAPLKNAESIKDILEFKLPQARDFDFSAICDDAKYNAGDRITVGGFWSGIFGDSYRLIGFEKFLLYSLLEPEMIKVLVNRITDMYLEINDILFSCLKDSLDIWFFGNDFGAQSGLLMGQEIWHDLFYENIKRLTAMAHSHGKKVMMHSCGSIYPLIPALIECGVDILDPIQVSADGMEIERLAREFKKRIVFHGGIDTQGLLVNGIANEVQSECAKTKELFQKIGGYIFAPSQIIGSDIPIQNIAAMYGITCE